MHMHVFPCTCTHIIYLLVGFEDIAAEGAVRQFSGDVTEDFHVLRVVGDIEDSAAAKNGVKFHQNT